MEVGIRSDGICPACLEDVILVCYSVELTRSFVDFMSDCLFFCELASEVLEAVLGHF
jgi:hypothetical protein